MILADIVKLSAAPSVKIPSSLKEEYKSLLEEKSKVFGSLSKTSSLFDNIENRNRDSIEKNRALVIKLDGSEFNVPIDSLYGLIKFICIEDMETTYKVGDVIESTMWHYKNTYIGEFFKPFCEFREERINQILYE